MVRGDTMRYKKNNRGSYILTDKNGNDFTVTKKEYEEISKLTKRANQRRVDVAHRYFDSMVDSNVMVGVDYEAYMTLLQRRGFITEKYTSSLQQFNSKADVNEHLKELRDEILNPLREAWGSAIIVTSGYRCKRLKEHYFG